MTALYVYLAAVNVLDFILMGADKAKAKRGARRIPEATLLLFAILGGSVGGILGMLLFRHKTRHAAFALGLPVILLVQLALAWAIWNFVI
jgi:uncharacterized membrane protein YsdA (DUF1294 family)